MVTFQLFKLKSIKKAILRHPFISSRKVTAKQVIASVVKIFPE